MRMFLSAMAIFASFLAPSVQAQNATVVELYTSQGCSSCPPADALLGELAKRDDVIALALHVDYWDYIGWKDDLADPAHTNRQRAFAQAWGARTVYTPQMVFNGQDHVIGSRPMDVMDQVQSHNQTPDAVTVTLVRNGGTLQINAIRNGNARGAAIVQVVRFKPSITRDIHRGENAGRTITYSNVVYSWDVAGQWNNLRNPLTMEAKIDGTDPVAVIIQARSDGPILGAAQLR